ncbi:MAG: nucleoside hydrolase, partial [Acidobacteria bacterium]|nr:nucleoside hydrolase [Acidobacteriota bacterium]
MSTVSRFRVALACVLLLVVADSAAAQRRKVIVDQDARGPATTDIQSILVFLQSPDVDVLGITLTSGDQWVTEETLHTLPVVELAGRTDVPVVPGAVYSLINTTDEAQWWEKQYGSFRRPYPLRLRPPDAIPELPEG